MSADEYDLPRWLSIKTLADLLGVKRKVVWRRVESGFYRPTRKRAGVWQIAKSNLTTVPQIWESIELRIRSGDRLPAELTVKAFADAVQLEPYEVRRLVTRGALLGFRPGKKEIVIPLSEMKRAFFAAFYELTSGMQPDDPE